MNLIYKNTVDHRNTLHPNTRVHLVVLHVSLILLTPILEVRTPTLSQPLRNLQLGVSIVIRRVRLTLLHHPLVLARTLIGNMPLLDGGVNLRPPRPPRPLRPLQIQVLSKDMMSAMKLQRTILRVRILLVVLCPISQHL